MTRSPSPTPTGRRLSMFDRASRRRLRNWAVGLFGPLLVRTWLWTVRARAIGAVREGRHFGLDRRAIFVFWHSQLLSPAGFFRGRRYKVLISEHADGEMIARVIEGLGLGTVRGSTTRGGAKALRRLLDAGDGPGLVHLILTPDGPKGPMHRFQSGAVYLASRAGLPIFVSCVGSSRMWRLRSWDRFRIPKPFSRCVFRVSPEPFEVPADLDRDGIEEWRQRLEQALRDIADDTDARFDELWAEAKPAKRLPTAREKSGGVSGRVR